MLGVAVGAAFSPFVNLYAVVFLIGGAILSALRYSADPATRHRVWANVLIAVGAILPGIGGTATRMGYTEVLYVTELAGLLLTWIGYRMSVRPGRDCRLRRDPSVPDEHASAIELTALRQLELHPRSPGSRNAGAPDAEQQRMDVEADSRRSRRPRRATPRSCRRSSR